LNEVLKRLVWERAAETCEYCRLPQWLDVLPFQIDHVIAEQHHGATVPENLALSCLNDNLHKGPNIAGLDPATGLLTRLFRRWWTSFIAQALSHQALAYVVPDRPLFA
jgi:hypothetical protein